MSNMFDQMLSRYEIRTKDEKLNATHEVMQQITLAGLFRGGFFNHAAFYGGACLRIFHKLPRFSEDMDFSLLKKDDSFNLENYFDAVYSEFKSLGREINIDKKEKKTESHIESAFLKDNTDIYNLKFQTEKTVKIKIEVDKDPPLQFNSENKLLLHPFSFMTRCYTLPCLYAGKMHVLVYRKWRGRVKGRDWFDFEWYAKNNAALDFNHLRERIAQSENSDKMTITTEHFMQQLKTKIQNTDINQVKADVIPFIKNTNELEIWSTDYFLQLADMIQFLPEK
ncbi:MAG TPA: nucleotidyl transferase AbiEii/AbiGii toxin family protein [Prolixibacteraceae bacterium]|mgnify:CR=1 FL=1|nr:nucleotidyl transferase AbiEii/AbiGii toxin family protein [Prolixibacteraceae bacterium]